MAVMRKKIRQSSQAQSIHAQSIHARDIGKRFHKHEIFHNITLDVVPGEILIITGPSGCGKSTLMYILSGLDKPSSGRVNSPDASERSFIFQDYNLLDCLHAKDNALAGARIAGRKVSKAECSRVFQNMGLAGLEHRLPHQLSGGQQQRVAVARALLSGAQFIFADEPTGALDAEATQRVLQAFRDLAASGKSVVIVTHSPQVCAIGDRVFSLTQGFIRTTENTQSISHGRTGKK